MVDKIIRCYDALDNGGIHFRKSSCSTSKREIEYTKKITILWSPRKSEDHSLDVIVISEGVRKNQKTSDKIGAVGISVHSSATSGTLRTDLY